MSIFEPWSGQRVGQFNPDFASSVVGKIQARNRRQSFDEGTTAVQTQKSQKPVKVRAQKPPKYKPVKLSEEPQMEQTTQTTQAVTPTTPKLPVKGTRAYPKMNKKQTAPGTKPKKK